jgi:hypothetical protein
LLAPLPSSFGAPTAKVLPSALRLTLAPNWSPAAAFEALMRACCDHAPALHTNTYTAPLAEAALESP